ncbi:borealin-related isoform X2 [Leptinotarsa decemlineata]|uniref:borealin-related isoform X2 n=1 Tax=Leptinotarsa decemlineata TaxID=7539 RepID=UPI003D30B42A
MPRTKASKKTAVKQEQTNDKTDNNEKYLLSLYPEMVENARKEALSYVENYRKSVLHEIQNSCAVERLRIPKKFMKMPMSEVLKLSSFSSLDNPSMVSKSCILKEDILNLVKSTTKNRRITRSSSFTDEGSRKSRNRAPKTTTSSTRRTRSLSKSNSLKVPSKQPKRTSSVQKTPINKVTPPNSYGTVTPKCKPNTPLVFLRRPKVGEVALSMQGSPLLTAPVVTEERANINIPLKNGDLMSLLPQSGLRMSQIPEFDQHTLRELDCLRANLDKVFEVTKKRYNLEF